MHGFSSFLLTIQTRILHRLASPSSTEEVMQACTAFSWEWINTQVQSGTIWWTIQTVLQVSGRMTNGITNGMTGEMTGITSVSWLNVLLYKWVCCPDQRLAVCHFQHSLPTHPQSGRSRNVGELLKSQMSAMIHHHWRKRREGGVSPRKLQPNTVREFVEVSIEETIMNTELGLGVIQVSTKNWCSLSFRHEFFIYWFTGEKHNVCNIHGEKVFQPGPDLLPCTNNTVCAKQSLEPRMAWKFLGFKGSTWTKRPSFNPPHLQLNLQIAVSRPFKTCLLKGLHMRKKGSCTLTL